jgi:hypothetical protein
MGLRLDQTGLQFVEQLVGTVRAGQVQAFEGMTDGLDVGQCQAITASRSFGIAQCMSGMTQFDFKALQMLTLGQMVAVIGQVSEFLQNSRYFGGVHNSFRYGGTAGKVPAWLSLGEQKTPA